MVRFLELATKAIADTVTELWAWFGGIIAAGGLDPRNWQPLTWVIVVALALLLMGLLMRRRPTRPGVAPELMVSHGVIELEEESDEGLEADELAAAGLAAPARAHHQLSLTLSNLNAYPLQLLELAVRTRGSRLPVVAEAGSVVPPHGAVDVTAELFDLPGDAGVIDLYLYSGGNRRRIWRLSAPLEWEPWTRAFRVKALAARITGVARLASQERRRHERRAFRGARRRQRQRELTEGAYRRADVIKEQLAQRKVEADQRAVQRAAEQRATEQRAAEQRIAAQQEAAQHAAAQQAAAQQAAAQHAAELQRRVPEPAAASAAPVHGGSAPMVGADGAVTPQPAHGPTGRGAPPRPAERAARRWPRSLEVAPTEASNGSEERAGHAESEDEPEVVAPKRRLEFPDEF